MRKVYPITHLFCPLVQSTHCAELAAKKFPLPGEASSTKEVDLHLQTKYLGLGAGDLKVGGVYLGIEETSYTWKRGISAIYFHPLGEEKNQK